MPSGRRRRGTPRPRCRSRRRPAATGAALTTADSLPTIAASAGRARHRRSRGCVGSSPSRRTSPRMRRPRRHALRPRRRAPRPGGPATIRGVGTTCRGGSGVHLGCDVGLDRRGRGHPQHGAVGEFARDPQQPRARARRRAPEPGWAGVTAPATGVGRPVLPVEVDGVAAQDTGEDAHVLLGAAARDGRRTARTRLGSAARATARCRG